MFRNSRLVSLAVLTIVFGFGCVGDWPINPDPDPQPFKSKVLVVHASPDAPGVDLLVDDMVAGTNLVYPNNTGYLDVDAGTRNIKVNVTGTNTTVIEDDLDLKERQKYSVFAVDAVANISALVLEDNFRLPRSGKTHVRFIHLSPDAPAVDITLKDGTVVFGNYSFKEASDFINLNAGNYELQVRLAGTDNVVLDLPSLSMEQRKVYTVFARGFVAGQDEQALNAEVILHNK